MSLFDTIDIACPSCSRPAAVEAVKSINADRRPDLRDAILDDSFQRLTCEGCGGVLRIDPQLIYLSLREGLWIVARPLVELPSWAEAQREARALFERNFGLASPPAAAELGAGLTPRLVFGWAALREKLLCRGEELDDVTVELTKAVLLFLPPTLPVADGIELRLVACDGDALRFARVQQETGIIDEFLDVPRGVYEQVGADPGWEDLVRRLRSGPLVDLQKTLLAPVPA